MGMPLKSESSTALRNAQLGITAYSGPAVEAFKALKYSNHSDQADEETVRQHFTMMETELVADTNAYLERLEKRLDATRE